VTFHQSLDARAVKVCERAAAAWWNHGGHGESGAVLGVIAALCLADKIDPKTLLASGDDEIAEGLGRTWAGFWLRRPELCIRCGPLAGWLDDDPPDGGLAKAAAAAARAAVKAGICDLLGDALRHLDLLGHAYMTMRPKSAAQARGEFYTPPALCETIARMTLGDELKPGMSIGEPAAGTGGMLRAAAQVMRERGLNPADFWWVANDISPLVTAALAVNCHLWGLGPRVIIGAADTLADPAWPARARAEQLAAIEQRDSLLSLTAAFAVMRQAGQLAAGPATPSRDRPSSCQAPLPGPELLIPGIELPSPGAAPCAQPAAADETSAP
jgi:hypothetical protein